jgi:autotransporter-associated beta strand repeat/autotransporter-associated beta strand repeat/autotransporter-associated beta strand repeat/autotransporter-associated beta strand repeat
MFFILITVIFDTAPNMPSSYAADSGWAVNSDGNWTLAGNWDNGVPGAVAPGTANTEKATFSSSLTADHAVTVDAGRNIKFIDFGNTSAFGYTLQTGAIALTSGGIIQTLAANGAHTDTISSAIAIQNSGTSGTASFTANATNASSLLVISGGVTGVATAGTTILTIDGSNTGNNTISGVIGNGAGGGALALAKAGTGTWVLSNGNTYSGLTTVTAGVLNIRNSTATGATTGGVTVSDGAALEMQGTIDVGNESLSLSGTGIANGGALRNILDNNSWAGPVSLGSATRINSDAGTLTIGGNISGAAQNLTVGGAGDAIINGVIGTTTGTLTKDGVGTLTLGGTNTYTGATTVNAGTLKAGKITQAFGNGSAVTVGAAGTLDIGGFNETLGSLSGSGVVTNSGAAKTLTVGNANSTTFSGVIDNAGGAIGLTKAGAGTLTLSGANTYTGNTAISRGILNAQSNSALGSGSVTVTGGNIAGLQLQGGITVANALTIASYGIGGVGALQNVSGDNNYTGLITLSADSRINSDSGTLTLSNAGTITGANCWLTVGGSGNTTINSAIGTGAGKLIKDGAGTFTLTGTNTYSGGTTISAGTVLVTSAGALGTGAVTNSDGGTLDIGTTALSGIGIYTQGATAPSTLKLTANSNTAYGSISAASAAITAANSTLNITVDGYIPTGAALTAITTTGGIDNAPGTITSSSSTVSFTAAKSGNNLVLTAVRSGTNSFQGAGAAVNSNDANVGAVLDNITSPSSDMTTVLNTLSGLSTGQVASAEGTMIPPVDAGVLNTSTASLNDFVGVSIERIKDILRLAAVPSSVSKTGISTGDEAGLSGVWGKGYGSYLNQGARKGIQGYDAWNAGTALGADHLFSDSVTLGVSGGWAYGNVDSDANNGNTYINSAQSTIYGGYYNDKYPFFIDISGSFAWNWYQGRRDITVGTISRRANASYDGQQYGAYIDGGYDIDIAKKTRLTPLLSLQWSHLHLQSYTETEAGALNLSINGQDYDILQSGVGASVNTEIESKWCTFIPEIHGKWLYDFLGDAVVSTSTFNGGGASFESNGAKPALNAFNVGGKLGIDLKNDISILMECDTELRDEFFGIYGAATVRYNF